MTRDEIIRMARDQGCPETATEGVFRVNVDDLGRLLAAEREECAKVAAWILKMAENDVSSAIRARGNVD